MNSSNPKSLERTSPKGENPSDAETKTNAVADAAPELDTDKLYARINLIRRFQGFSQAQLAEKAGLPQSYISKIDTQQIKDPSLANIYRIAGALQFSLEALLADENTFLAALNNNLKSEAIQSEVLDSEENSETNQGEISGDDESSGPTSGSSLAQVSYHKTTSFIDPSAPFTTDYLLSRNLNIDALVKQIEPVDENQAVRAILTYAMLALVESNDFIYTYNQGVKEGDQLRYLALLDLKKLFFNPDVDTKYYASLFTYSPELKYVFDPDNNLTVIDDLIPPISSLLYKEGLIRDDDSFERDSSLANIFNTLRKHIRDSETIKALESRDSEEDIGADEKDGEDNEETVKISGSIDLEEQTGNIHITDIPENIHSVKALKQYLNINDPLTVFALDEESSLSRAVDSTFTRSLASNLTPSINKFYYRFLSEAIPKKLTPMERQMLDDVLFIACFPYKSNTDGLSKNEAKRVPAPFEDDLSDSDDWAWDTRETPARLLPGHSIYPEISELIQALGSASMCKRLVSSVVATHVADQKRLAKSGKAIINSSAKERINVSKVLKDYQQLFLSSEVDTHLLKNPGFGQDNFYKAKSADTFLSDEHKQNIKQIERISAQVIIEQLAGMPPSNEYWPVIIVDSFDWIPDELMRLNLSSELTITLVYIGDLPEEYKPFFQSIEA